MENNYQLEDLEEDLDLYKMMKKQVLKSTLDKLTDNELKMLDKTVDMMKSKRFNSYILKRNDLYQEAKLFEDAEYERSKMIKEWNKITTESSIKASEIMVDYYKKQEDHFKEQRDK